MAAVENGAAQEVVVGIAQRVVASVGIAAAVTLAGAGVAGAQPEAPEPESPLTQYVEMLPPAPPQCAAMWEPIEDRIEDMVPCGDRARVRRVRRLVRGPHRLSRS